LGNGSLAQLHISALAQLRICRFAQECKRANPHLPDAPPPTLITPALTIATETFCFPEKVLAYLAQDGA
jgi:hypothetical protein